MFNFLSRKKEIEIIKGEIKKSFSDVKEDIEKVGKWIKHLNNRDEGLNEKIKKLEEDFSKIEQEIESIKEKMLLFESFNLNRVFKTQTGVYKKQTGVYDVQTGVQTGVQTDKIRQIANLSVTERAIVFLIANSDLKLSYEDLALMLGKTKSTIRGQINSIKAKSEGLIEEYIEENGKKRIYMPQEVKENILKTIKVRVRKEKNNENKEKKVKSES